MARIVCAAGATFGALSLINCQSISKTFGARPLFENVSLTIADGERIGLIGPNGSGKTTLARILAGLAQPDTGLVAFRKGLALGYVPQEPEFAEADTVRSAVESALLNDPHLDPLDRDARVHVTLGKLGFADFDARAASLSGGWRKRLAIARELVREPDVLLLDEPTNHLDLDGILWLERFLASARFACLVISHDRYFLENVATDMAEINRVYPEGLFRVRGNYSEFLGKREEFLAAQSKYRDSLENKVRREVEWLRRGPKARTTKSKARIDNAQQMIGELDSIEARSGSSQARIDFTASGRQTKKLYSAEGLAKSLGGRLLFSGIDLTLRPGVRLGLAGPNGSGKTTLLRIVAGELEPDNGTVEQAEALKIVYFDQHREELPLDQPLRKALCEHGDHVIYRDRPLHVASWAKRFLFHNEQLDLAVGRLSGGERARLAIARLMLRPADLLLLDEPTNDLDIPTLEVLEDSLLDFPGALVLVTHDRYMLDRVSTAVLGIGEGAAGMFADYSQWEQTRSGRQRLAKAEQAEAAPAAPAKPAKKKLSYIEAREWSTIEARIHDAERELAAAQRSLEEPAIASDPGKLHDAYERVQRAQAEVDRLFARWAELEEKQA